MAANQSVYEGMFLIDANRFARDRDGSVGEVEKLLANAGAEMLVSRLWEERRLAYPIRGQRKGAYWLTYFKIDRSNLQELTRQCEINETILRQLFVRLPESLVDPIVEHAKGSATEQPQESEAPSKSVPAEPAAP